MISNNDEQNNVQNEIKENEFININQNVNNYEDNDDLNFGQLNNLGINAKEENKIKEPITKKRNKTKKKTKEDKTTTTTFKTSDIREIAIHKTSLLDLFNSGKNYSEFIKEKEEEEKKNTIINEDVNIKKVNESDIPGPPKVEEHGDDDDDGDGDGDDDNDDDDLFNVSEEDEEIKRQRSAAIEKMTKKYDEIVPIPDFNIFDESKIKMFKKTNDFY